MRKKQIFYLFGLPYSGFLYWSCLISILPNSRKEKHEYKTFTQVFPNSLSCNHNFGIEDLQRRWGVSLLLNQSTAQSLCLTKSISNWKGVSSNLGSSWFCPLDPFFCWDASLQSWMIPLSLVQGNISWILWSLGLSGWGG